MEGVMIEQTSDLEAVLYLFPDRSSSTDFSTPRTVFLADGLETVSGLNNIPGVPGYQYIDSAMIKAFSSQRRDQAIEAARRVWNNDRTAKYHQAKLRHLLQAPNLTLVHVYVGLDERGIPFSGYGYILN
jgi:hypothetical protein